jgi:hypothetical protein
MSRTSPVARHCLLALAALGLVTLALSLWPGPAAAEGPWPQTRKGWFIGGGLGGGTAAITHEGESSDREGGAAGSFRAGYAFTPQLGFGLESSAWSKEQEGVTVTFSTGGVALSYYPAGGLVLRGGVGLGSVKAAASEGNRTVEATESGLGLMAGAAYEFRVLRTFSLGPEVTFGYVKAESFDVNFFNVCLGLNWYFIPKN